MKRLVGVTLSETLANPTVTRQRVLRAFADVCRAVDFAHSRGVVHRDLKPANISLGEFGEVYVIDWGVARVLGDAPEQVVTADIDTLEGSSPSDKVPGPRATAFEQPASPRSSGRTPMALGAILQISRARRCIRAPRPRSIAARRRGHEPAKRRAHDSAWSSLCVQMLARDPAVRPTGGSRTDEDTPTATRHRAAQDMATRAPSTRPSRCDVRCVAHSPIPSHRCGRARHDADVAAADRATARAADRARRRG
jgi:serine/threonine protein kinase